MEPTIKGVFLKSVVTLTEEAASVMVTVLTVAPVVLPSEVSENWLLLLSVFNAPYITVSFVLSTK